MYMRKIGFILSLLLTTLVISSFISVEKDMRAYVIYDSSGKEVSYEKMMKSIHGSDVVLIGELHNNPISHWIQLEVTQSLYEKEQKNLVLGAEMFESDNQLILNEYLTGAIKEDNFKKEVKLWPNYDTDYKPLVEYAKSNKLDFIATNTPRRYASIVYNRGFSALDSLTDEAKKYIAPIPIKYDPEVGCYKKMKEMMGGHGGLNLPKAQALKDATMAHFILQNWEKDKCFVHYNGAYHSDYHEGIAYYLQQSNAELKTQTITTVLQDDVSYLFKDNKNKADFIICVNADMTTTH